MTILLTILAWTILVPAMIAGGILNVIILRELYKALKKAFDK